MKLVKQPFTHYSQRRLATIFIECAFNYRHNVHVYEICNRPHPLGGGGRREGNMLFGGISSFPPPSIKSILFAS